MPIDLATHFPRYDQFDPSVPVYCVTPETDKVLHRFFDTSPFSPSGRYMALCRIPHEDRVPKPGQVAHVVLVDLATGDERILAETHGWDAQLGAQVQWGTTDAEMYFNDMDIATWRPYGVKMDPLTGARQQLDGSVYMISPDGTQAASPCLKRTAICQKGYGVVVPDECIPVNHGAVDDDGLYITDTHTGACRLLVSFKQIVEEATPALDRPAYANGDFYGFHVKWNRQGTRLMFVVRWFARDANAPVERHRDVITMAADGSDIHVAIPDIPWWSKGGHHPNWAPDGDTVTMNINVHGDGMRFVEAPYDGSDFRVITESMPGSGHPTLHPNGKQMVTDAYPFEPVAFGDHTTPIRLIDLPSDTEQCIVRIGTVPSYSGPDHDYPLLRVDPHPAWDPTFTRLAINACPDGTRRVYVLEMDSALT